VKSSLCEAIGLIVNDKEAKDKVELLEALFKKLVNKNKSEMLKKDLIIQELKDDVSKKDESIKVLENEKNNLDSLLKKSENKLKVATGIYEEKEAIYKEMNENTTSSAATQLATLKDEYCKLFSTCALTMGMNISGMRKSDILERGVGIDIKNVAAQQLKDQLKVAQNQLKMGKIVVGSALIMAILAYLLKNYTDILTVPISEISYVGA
jgi:hypothetical protein